MLKNCVEWVIFDQAALGLGLVTVPLYLDDRPDSAAYILNHSGAKLLLVEGKFQHKKLAEITGSAHSAAAYRQSDRRRKMALVNWSTRFVVVADWLAAASDTPVPERHPSADLLVSIVYTSGTTGTAQGRDADARKHAVERLVRIAVRGFRVRMRCSCPSCRCRTRWSAPAATTCRC